MANLKAFEVLVDVPGIDQEESGVERWIVIACDMDEALETLHLDVEEQGPPYTDLIEANMYEIGELSQTEIKAYDKVIMRQGKAYDLEEYLAKCKEPELII